MEFIYEAERIYVKDASGRMAAQVTFHQRSDRAMSIDHTYVSPELRGQGAGGKAAVCRGQTLPAAGAEGGAGVLLRRGLVPGPSGGIGPFEVIPPPYMRIREF